MEDEYCRDCALRLFNDKYYNFRPIGNVWSGNLIVLPNVDKNAYRKGDMSYSNQVKIIADALSLTSTGGLLDLVCIVPLIRCCETSTIDIDSAIVKSCLRYLERDMRTFQFKNVLLLGSAATRLINDSVKFSFNAIFKSKNKRNYVVNYSPLVKYYSDEYFQEFKKHLENWFTYINTGSSSYNIINI